MDNMLVLLPKDEKPGFFFFGLFMDCLHAKIRSHLLTESIADPSWMATRVDELWTVPGRCSQDVVYYLNNSDNTGFYTPSPSTTNGSRCIFLQDVPSPTVLPQGWDSLPVIRLICDLHSLSGSMLLCDTSSGIHCPIDPGKMRRSYFSSRQVCFSKTGFKKFFSGKVSRRKSIYCLKPVSIAIRARFKPISDLPFNKYWFLDEDFYIFT